MLFSFKTVMARSGSGHGREKYALDVREKSSKMEIYGRGFCKIFYMAHQKTVMTCNSASFGVTERNCNCNVT